MRQKFLDCQENLKYYMGYAKQYLEYDVEDPIEAIKGLYEIDDSVTIELAHNMETEIEKMDKILDDDPDILF